MLPEKLQCSSRLRLMTVRPTGMQKLADGRQEDKLEGYHNLNPNQARSFSAVDKLVQPLPV